MISRGQAFWPAKITLPPGSATTHRAVVLTSNNMLAKGAGWVLIAIIRSAKHQDGRPVRPVPLHSILLTPQECGTWLTADSFIETHQLFHYPVSLLQNDKPLGNVPLAKVKDALSGAKLLFD